MRRVRHPRSSALVALFVLVATVVLAACGGGDDDDGASGKVDKLVAQNGKVTVVAKDIFFNTKTIEATAGPLEITLQNKGAQLHDFKVDNPDFKVAADPGGDKVGTITLEAGKTYSFYCDVPGHRAQGMNGTLVVK